MGPADEWIQGDHYESRSLHHSNAYHIIVVGKQCIASNAAPLKQNRSELETDIAINKQVTAFFTMLEPDNTCLTSQTLAMELVVGDNDGISDSKQ